MTSLFDDHWSFEIDETHPFEELEWRQERSVLNQIVPRTELNFTMWFAYDGEKVFEMKSNPSLDQHAIFVRIIPEFEGHPLFKLIEDANAPKRRLPNVNRTQMQPDNVFFACPPLEPRPMFEFTMEMKNINPEVLHILFGCPQGWPHDGECFMSNIVLGEE